MFKYGLFSEIPTAKDMNGVSKNAYKIKPVTRIIKHQIINKIINAALLGQYEMVYEFDHVFCGKTYMDVIEQELISLGYLIKYKGENFIVISWENLVKKCISKKEKNKVEKKSEPKIIEIKNLSNARESILNIIKNNSDKEVKIKFNLDDSHTIRDIPIINQIMIELSLLKFDVDYISNFTWRLTW